MTIPEPDTAAFTPFQALIEGHARARPHDVVFRVDDRLLDWKTLQAHVVDVAQSLLREGLTPGDRVAILGAPSLAYIECLFGALAARACVVPLPVSASMETLEALLSDCDARVLFLDPDCGDAALALAARLAVVRGLRVVVFGGGGAEGDAFADWRAQGGQAPVPQASPEDAFNIIYSSGTTGLPKGIVHLHGMRQRQAARNGFGLSLRSRTLLSTPMYSNTTILPMLGTVAHGGTCILMRKFDAGRWLALAAGQRVTHTMLVPVQYQRLLAHAAFAAADLSALELSQSTGAPMDIALKREILRRWPGRFLEAYGLTEGGVACFLDARQHPDKLGTVGKPGYGSEVFLIDSAGRRLPPGQVGVAGEVVGRSSFMMAGYHNRPEADAQIRWLDEEGRICHRTGDIGRFDAEGFLTLLDRIKDVIISGGHNIYASDLEAVLARHEDVLEAAVVGVPSTAWGETPLALVALRPGARVTAQQLRDWVNAQVGKMQRLSGVELRETLPRNALGKLSKRELRAPYWQARASAEVSP
jgi:long-chain acyl-CoA synthetase